MEQKGTFWLVILFLWGGGVRAQEHVSALLDREKSKVLSSLSQAEKVLEGLDPLKNQILACQKNTSSGKVTTPNETKNVWGGLQNWWSRRLLEAEVEDCRRTIARAQKEIDSGIQSYREFVAAALNAERALWDEMKKRKPPLDELQVLSDLNRKTRTFFLNQTRFENQLKNRRTASIVLEPMAPFSGREGEFPFIFLGLFVFFSGIIAYIMHNIREADVKKS